MSNCSRLHTIILPWRRFRASLPAVALMGSGILFAAQASPGYDINGAVSNDAPAIVVPDVAMTLPVDPPWLGTPDLAQPAPPADVALVLPVGTVAGSSEPVALDTAGIPIRALEAYRAAATLVGAADPGCHIDWALVAAIGRVESDHARFGGNRLDPDGVAQPGIIGIPLDGSNGTARITDTDGGRYDRDTVFDRAVGPMQFIPGTWASMGVDADRDGVKNPQDMTDAATATAIYLCSGPGDLRRPDDLTAAIMRYNHSDSYVRTVTAIANAYRNGVSAIPASDMPIANVVSASGVVTAAPVSSATVVPGVQIIGTSVAPGATVAAVTTAPITALTTAAVTAVTTSPITGLTTSATTIPAAPMVTDPATTVAPVTDPTTTVVQNPTTTVPTTTVPTTTVPTTTVPTTTVPTTTVPTTTVPTTTVPTTTDPDPTTTAPTTTAVATTTVPDPCLTPPDPTLPTLPAPTACVTPTPTIVPETAIP